MVRRKSEEIEEKEETAMNAEDSDVATAIKSFETAIEQNPTNVAAFNRLMVLYRKEKRYKQELQLIEKGIANILKERDIQLKGLVKGKKNKKQLEDLSAAFMKSSGLRDKKGNPTSYPDPVTKWMKRKETVLKRLKKKS